jgi:hypothetical protein
MNSKGKKMPKPSNQDILLEELRIIQDEMKSANITLGKVTTTLENVEKQTIKTNGRVTKVEERLNMHRGGIVVAWALIGLVVAIFKYIN